MNIIATVDNNWGIGANQKVLVNIPADQRFIREVTTNKAIVMGRRAYEELVTTLPVGNRAYYVLSKNPNYVAKGATVVHSIKELLEEVKEYNTEDIFLYGGESIYKQLLEYCDCAHITKIDFNYHATTFHPNLDQDADWELVGVSEEQTYYDLEYVFCKYVRKKK